MYHLATIWPAVRRFRLPLSRDQLMLLMVATNELFLGVDTYLAHSISGTIRPNEWIPILFGPIAGVVMLLAGLLAGRRRDLATVLALLTMATSMVVGLLGAYFHVARAFLPAAPQGERVTLDLLVWAPPILGPLMFVLVGILGASAVLIESPADSGRLRLPAGLHIELPYSKTRAYLFMVSMGALATLISSMLDHARTHFENPWLWLPLAAGILAVVVPVVVASVDRPSRGDLVTYAAAMLLLILVGLIGALLHVDSNLVLEGTVVVERFIRGAPILAPLLFANIGLLGLLALLDPAEHGHRRATGTQTQNGPGHPGPF